MELSELSIRELFAELTTVEDALEGRTERRLSAPRRRVLEQHQAGLVQELRSRTAADTPTGMTQQNTTTGMTQQNTVTEPSVQDTTGTISASLQT